MEPECYETVIHYHVDLRPAFIGVGILFKNHELAWICSMVFYLALSFFMARFDLINKQAQKNKVKFSNSEDLPAKNM